MSAVFNCCSNKREPNSTWPQTASPLLTAYCFFVFFRSRHAGPEAALSTLDRGHRRDGFLLVSDDDREIPFLNRAQRSVVVIGIGFVPVKAGEVFLRPLILENFAVARVDFIAHLAHIFDEQAVQQRARDRPF